MALFDGRRRAEARHVLVLARLLLPAPGMVGVGDAGDVLVGEFILNSLLLLRCLTRPKDMENPC